MSFDQLIELKVTERVEIILQERTEEIKEALLVQPMYLSRGDAAKYLSVSLSTIDNYVRWGMLPKYKPKRGNYTRFKREDLDNILVNS